MEDTAPDRANTEQYADDDDIDLLALWQTIWQGKWMIIGITALFTLAAVAYALNATQWYRAEVLLSPAGTKSTEGLAGQLGNLGGLASLAGISVGASNTSEPLAVLKSRDFARAFIEDQKLLPILFANKWDATSSRWTPADPKDWPDIRDGEKYFGEKVLFVAEDKKTGLINLSIEWKEAKLAADWANMLAERVNDRMRERALVEAQANISFLHQELATTNLVTLQQSIGRLLDSEIQKLMLARGKKEFAFRVIDRAEVPKWRSWPKRAQVVGLGALGGAVLSVFSTILLQAFRSRRGEAAQQRAINRND